MRGVVWSERVSNINNNAVRPVMEATLRSFSVVLGHSLQVDSESPGLVASSTGRVNRLASATVSKDYDGQRDVTVRGWALMLGLWSNTIGVRVAVKWARRESISCYQPARKTENLTRGRTDKFVTYLQFPIEICSSADRAMSLA